MKETKNVEINELAAADSGRLAPRASSKQAASGAFIGIAAAVAVTTGILGFFGGMHYQKGTASSTVSSQNGMGGQGGMMGGPGSMSRGGSFGEVTAVSDSSITVALMSGGPNSSSTSSSSKTFTINSSTTITIDGSSGSVSDISAGDTVMVQADSSDSSLAASVRVGMGGAPGAERQSATSSTSSET